MSESKFGYTLQYINNIAGVIILGVIILGVIIFPDLYNNIYINS
jgi:hypothetical protein